MRAMWILYDMIVAMPKTVDVKDITDEKTDSKGMAS